MKYEVNLAGIASILTVGRGHLGDLHQRGLHVRHRLGGGACASLFLGGGRDSQNPPGVPRALPQPQGPRVQYFTVCLMLIVVGFAGVIA